MSIKRCLQCRMVKPVTEFYYNGRQNGRVKWVARCKECFLPLDRKRRNARKQFLLKTQGVTYIIRRKLIASRAEARRHGYLPCLATVEELLPDFSLSCVVCNQHVGPSINLDHDHLTGKFRGWLCGRCNVLLGQTRDSPELLQSLIDYLRRNEIT